MTLKKILFICSCLTIRQLEGAAIRLKTKVLELKNTALLFAFGVTKSDGHDDIK